MANVFKVKTKSDLPSNANTNIYTVPASTTSIVLGMILSNKSTATIKATVYLETDTIDSETNETVALMNEVAIPQNSSLEVFQGQKLVLQTTDIIKAKCDSNTSLDFALSILEMT
jgi:hypothetical protein